MACTSHERKPVEMSCAPGQGRGPDGKCATKLGTLPANGEPGATVTLPPGGASGSDGPITAEIAGPAPKPGTASGAAAGTAAGGGTATPPPIHSTGSGSVELGTGSAAVGAGSGLAGSGGVASGAGSAAAGTGSAATASGSAAIGSGSAAIGSGSAAIGSGSAAAQAGSIADTAGGAGGPDDNALTFAFPAGTPAKGTDGAPWVAVKLAATASGVLQVRLAFSHLDGITDARWSADKAVAPPKVLAVADGLLQIEAFALPITVTFKFNNTTCKAGPFAASRAASSLKPVCQ